jgi:hypothetical protein
MNRPRISNTTFDRPLRVLPESRTAGDITNLDSRGRRPHRESDTWSSSNADINLLSKEEEVDNPIWFVAEYNRLAKKVCLLSESSLLTN